MALCSRMKSECRMARPTQKLPATPDRSANFWRSSGGRPRSSMRSRPFSCDRRPSAKSSLPPYTCDPSHQWVSPVTYVGGPLASGLGSGFVRQDLHRVLGPRVVLLERDLPGVGQLRIVAQPVVHLELDPSPGQQVERRRGLEGLAREEPAADEPRVRVEQPLRIVRVGVLQRHVSPEPAPERAHERVVEVVVGAVDHPRTEVAADVGILERRLVERPAARVVEVLRAESVAQPDQDGDRGDRRQPRPAERAVDLLGRIGDKLRELPRHPGALSSYRTAAPGRASTSSPR